MPRVLRFGVRSTSLAVFLLFGVTCCRSAKRDTERVEDAGRVGTVRDTERIEDADRVGTERDTGQGEDTALETDTGWIVCGDNRVTGEETCEDDDPPDDLQSEDGCDDRCQIEEGWSCPVPGEACAYIGICGNGVLEEAAGELCDDGNTEPGDGCGFRCRYIEHDAECPVPGEPCFYDTVCGDKRLVGDETCDDGNDDPNDGCDQCELQPGYFCFSPNYQLPCRPICGDGLVRGYEACDDGNRDDGDGCSGRCMWESEFACTGDPGEYRCWRTVCGDGIVEGSETCDMGDQKGAPGCSADCRVLPSCGDGVVAADLGETCDDKNIYSGDGCSAQCQVEYGYECGRENPDDEKDNCETVCGDGVLAPGESCDVGLDALGHYACGPDCRVYEDSYCGDGVVQGCEGCDDGYNDAPIGVIGCPEGCNLGSFCGDGSVDSDFEDCDDGYNLGGYNKCAPGCVYGPYCGDGVVQPEWGEQCDDGGNQPDDGCGPDCQ